MNETSKNFDPVFTDRLPLNKLIRRRREELFLSQADVAEALSVTAEAVGLWEGARRRMELSKLPRLATVLQLDAKQLCLQALAEFYPLVHAALVRAETAANN